MYFVSGKYFLHNAAIVMDKNHCSVSLDIIFIYLFIKYLKPQFANADKSL